MNTETQSRPGVLRVNDDSGNYLEVHYHYFPATPHRNMSGRVEDAEHGEDSEIDAVNIIAHNQDGEWVAIHDLLEDLPGFDSGKLLAYLKEREDGRDD